jgi:hypothetical protein
VGVSAFSKKQWNSLHPAFLVFSAPNFLGVLKHFFENNSRINEEKCSYLILKDEFDMVIECKWFETPPPLTEAVVSKIQLNK